MVHIKKILLTRKMVLTLIFLIISAMLLSVFVPQKFTATSEELKEWYQTHPLMSKWAQGMGMDHIYTTPWFAILLLMFILSMILSACDQILLAWKTTFAEPSGAISEGGKIPVSKEKIKAVCRKFGYLQTAGEKGNLSFVKHPWGFWGNSLLHTGIVIVLLASLWIVLHQRRGLISLWEDAMFKPGDPWQAEERGLAATRFVLTKTVKLDRVRPEFYENNRLKQLNAELSFIGEDNSVSHYPISVNNMLRYDGLDIYQSLNFGHAFFVLFSDEIGSSHPAILKILHPESLEKPSYGEFKIYWMDLPYLLQAKYYVDVNKNDINSSDPLLVLRLLEEEKEVGQLRLRVGEQGKIGQYDAWLVKAALWTDIIFVDLHGMTFIFIGFGVIILGGGLNYFTPPRKLLAKKDGDGYILHWQASKFPEFYSAEKNKIFDVLSQRNIT